MAFTRSRVRSRQFPQVDRGRATWLRRVGVEGRPGWKPGRPPGRGSVGDDDRSGRGREVRLRTGRHAWVHVARGAVSLNGTALREGAWRGGHGGREPEVRRRPASRGPVGRPGLRREPGCEPGRGRSDRSPCALRASRDDVHHRAHPDPHRLVDVHPPMMSRFGAIRAWLRRLVPGVTRCTSCWPCSRTMDSMPKHAEGRYTAHLVLFAALVLASAGSTLLVAGRVFHTGRLTYGFLVYNLTLAWIPLTFAAAAEAFDRLKSRLGTGLTLLSIGAWLVFFPNAPYIVTDLMHLRVQDNRLLWLDLIALQAFACTGLALGFLSLAIVQRIVARRVG